MTLTSPNPCCVEGIADSRYINSLIDQESGTMNEKLTPGGFFTLQGRRIKAAGDDPRVGVYFIPLGAESPDGIAGTYYGWHIG
jgi:hypothetical protein